ncbi:MAG: FAD-dependent oxidoreductase [Deltaproteobacteria bacterium]|nr:FAD-dependent oxidoreductase [Deltaproteobacteria bacterium]
MPEAGPGSAKVVRQLPARPAGSVSHARVVVVGGGLAGLVTAYELEKSGIETHVLEATDVWGGRVTTAYYAPDLHAEFGMQEVWATNPLLEVARELHVPIEGEAEPAFSSIILDGRVVPFLQDTPDEYFASFLRPDERQALRDWLGNAERLHHLAKTAGLRDGYVRDLEGISFKTWIDQSGVPPRVAEFLRLTIECELAADWEQFSALIGLLEFEVFFGDGAPNYHVQGGNQRVIDALVGAIRGEKTLGATVTQALRTRGSDGATRVRVQYVKDHVLSSVEGERVVLAVPFVRLHQILTEPPLSEEKWQAIRTLMRGQYTVVHFLVDKQIDSLWGGDGGNPFPVLSRGPLGVIYGINETTPDSQPLQVFSLLVYGMAANAWHMAPREQKVREALAELDRLWPGFSGHVRETHAYSHHPAAIPIWPPGRSPIDEGGDALRAPEMGLWLAGDYTLNAHSEGAVRSGLRVAREIARDLAPSGR